MNFAITILTAQETVSSATARRLLSLGPPNGAKMIQFEVYCAQDRSACSEGKDIDIIGCIAEHGGVRDRALNKMYIDQVLELVDRRRSAGTCRSHCPLVGT